MPITEPKRGNTRCVRCQDVPELPDPPDQYAYLLGLYVGDGCISSYRRKGYGLRIAGGDAWPGLMAECESALRAVRRDRRVHRAPKQGCQLANHRNLSVARRESVALMDQHVGPKY